MIERWLTAIRDHPERPPALQRLALYSLALRMNWTTGRGFASTSQVAADAGAEDRTVRRATRWAREHELLLRTRRGHYINKETSIASEWQLTQPVTGDLLAGKPTGQNGEANRTISRPNRSAAQHHQELSSSESSSSARGPASPAASPRGHLEDPHLLGDLGTLTAYSRPHSEACRARDHKFCLMSWCACTCHRGGQS